MLYTLTLIFWTINLFMFSTETSLTLMVSLPYNLKILWYLII